jgi:hypothetical protein
MSEAVNVGAILAPTHPIHVIAISEGQALAFVRDDLRENPRRLRWTRDPERLRGLPVGQLVYVLPGPNGLRGLGEAVARAQSQGLVLATVDDRYARERWGDRTR